MPTLYYNGSQYSEDLSQRLQQRVRTNIGAWQK